MLVAALRLPVYITTNYDVLFEKAWKFVNGKEIPVIVNSADLDRPDVQRAIDDGTGVLFKIHGCASRRDEYLILTRRDYRRHYRLNSDFFAKLKDIIRIRHTLFLGFSHTDPEVSRLVEDTIYEYEHLWEEGEHDGPRPHFFSLQFDMRSHTPEVFAARGIVALRSPPMTGPLENIRSQRLGVALADMATIRCHSASPDVEVYEHLQHIVDTLSTELRQGLEHLETASPYALIHLDDNRDCGWLEELQQKLGPAGEPRGVSKRMTKDLSLSMRLQRQYPMMNRATTAGFSQRPYFQQAKTFRTKFVSDSAESVFNQRSTFFLCCPLMSDGHMAGLLFSACQIGQWNTPLDLARTLWGRDEALLLIDSNGLCLLPSQNEFPLDGLNENGDYTANSGYSHRRLLYFESPGSSYQAYRQQCNTDLLG